MNIGQEMGFAIRGIGNSKLIVEMYERGRKVISLRRDMRAAGTDVPKDLIQQYDVIEKFVDEMGMVILGFVAKNGIFAPDLQRAAEPQATTEAPALKGKGGLCDCSICRVTRNEKAEKAAADPNAADARSKEMLERILALLGGLPKIPEATQEAPQVNGLRPGGF